MCSHLLLICCRFIVILGECIVPCSAIALLSSLYLSPLYPLKHLVHHFLYLLYISSLLLPCNAIALLSSLYMSPLYIIVPCNAIALLSIYLLYILLCNVHHSPEVSFLYCPIYSHHSVQSHFYILS